MSQFPVQAPTRPEDVLPDGVERTVIAGVDVRKGTVAAFVRNALQWLDRDTPAERRAVLTDEMARTVPALRALGLLDVFDIRDATLQALVDRS